MATNGTDFSAPVARTNLRKTARPAAPRRDPDDDTATAATAAPAPEPEQPPAPAAGTEPGDNRPKPGQPKPTDPPPVTSNAVAHPGPAAGGGTLASVLTAPNHVTGGHDVPQGVAALAGLAAMQRRPVDPMEDWVGDGTRTPRWLKQAIAQYALLSRGREKQEVQRDLLLGVDRIPEDILDANWLDCYGYPRSQYDPRAYR